MNYKKIVLLVLGAVALGLFFYFDLQRFLTLASLKANRQLLLDYYNGHKLVTVAGFMAIYVLQTTLSLPGAAVMSGRRGNLWFGHGYRIC